MTHLGLRLTLLSLVLLLTQAVPVQAIEILELSTGSISFTRDMNRGAMNLQGPRLALTDFVHPIGVGPLFWEFKRCAGVPAFFGFGCDPGTKMGVGGTAIGSDVFATAALDGVPHPAGGADASLVTDGLVLTTAGSVLIPDFGDISFVVLKVPFVLTGELFRNNCFPAGTFPPTTVYELHGQGVFTLSLDCVLSFNEDAWRWHAASFDLQPTPEPTTLLLCGTSAPGLGLVSWRRRNARERGVVGLLLGAFLALGTSAASATGILTLDAGTSRISAATGFGALVNVSGQRLLISALQSPVFTTVPCLGAGCPPGTLVEAGWLF